MLQKLRVSVQTAAPRAKSEWAAHRWATHPRCLIWREPVNSRWSRHPEGFVTFAVCLAAGDADVAQGRVAEALQLLARPRAALPFAEAQYDLIPTGQAVRPEIRHCGGAHGSLHTRQFIVRLLVALFCNAACDRQHSLSFYK
jgi:hypothetical protein